MTRAIQDEFYRKVFPWNAEDSARIWRALAEALDKNDELLDLLLDADEDL